MKLKLSAIALRHGCLAIVFVLHCTVVQAQSAPLQEDLAIEQLILSIEKKDHAEVLRQIDRLRSISPDVSGEVLFFEAKAAQAVGHLSRAYDAALRYAEEMGNSGENYGEALILLAATGASVDQREYEWALNNKSPEAMNRYIMESRTGASLAEAKNTLQRWMNDSRGVKYASNRRVGRLEGRSDNGQPVLCTASSMRSEYILTSAHCFFDAKGKLLKDVYYYPGVSKEFETPADRFRVTQVFVPQRFLEADGASEAEHNIALAKVAANGLGNGLPGSFGYWGMSRFNSTHTYARSYRATNSDFTQYFELSCAVQQMSELVLRTQCTKVEPRSGAPALVYSPKSKQYAVHGVFGGESGGRATITRITPERHRIITSIIQGKYAQESSNHSEKWDSLAMAPARSVNVRVRNDLTTCADGTAFASSRGAEGPGEAKKTRGAFRVEPGQTKEILKSHYGDFEVFIHGQKSYHVIGDYKSIIPSTGREGHFKNFIVRSYGDHLIHLMICQAHVKRN